MKFKTVFFFFFLIHSVFGSNKYWISFTDKKDVHFDPYTYFDSRTIEQRIRQHIPLNDSSDYPVSETYLQHISALADSMSCSSRWLNGVAVFCSEENIERIRNLPFVRQVSPMTYTALPATLADNTIRKLPKQFDKLLHYQTDRLQGGAFKKNKFDGKGIRIAILDAGFPGYKSHSAFNHLRTNKQIIATHDFIKNRDEVELGHWHGTATLSCIAGMMDSTNIGLATGAELLLARTEYSAREPLAEEEYWLAAAEWADKLGANIISSSLGYTDRHYFNFEMNGKNSLVARAATIAAQKGILVVNAAGNEGNDAWHFIDTPADADSVLTVGGTDPYTDFHIYFSSYGPTSDGRLKPNVVAPAQAICAIPGNFAQEDGTSFSTPLIAGFAACAWQSHRGWTNMELFNAIEESGHLYPYFDYAHGFGVPQADKILGIKETQEPTFDFVILNENVKVVLREKYSYQETESALGYSARRNFYYKIEDASGAILKYSVLLADRKEMMAFSVDQLGKGEVLTVHFEGYTSSLDFQEDK